MKRIFALTIIGLALSAVISSCGSSNTGHCDAYGRIDNTQNTDLASK